MSDKTSTNKLYSGELRKLSNNKNELRTNTVKGFFTFMPEVGKRFTFLGDPIDLRAAFRMVLTSEVTDILAHVKGDITFQTENSIYQVIYE